MSIDKSSMTREYKSEFYRVKAHPRSCFFCDHLTDIFWDYSHGPYMFYCEIEQEIDTGMCGECKQFVEDVGE